MNEQPIPTADLNAPASALLALARAAEDFTLLVDAGSIVVGTSVPTPRSAAGAVAPTLIGAAFSLLWPMPQAESIAALLAATRRTGRPQRAELHWGDGRYVHTCDIAVLDGGAPGQLCCAFRRRPAAELGARGRFDAALSLVDVALSAARMTLWQWDVATDEISSVRGDGTAVALPVPTGAALFAAIHPEDVATVRTRFEEVARTGWRDTFSVDYRLRTAGDDYRWIESRGRAVFDAHDRVTAWYGIATDITARHDAEAERERLQRQLAQAQKMESIGLLTGGIAHDFNNMLASVLGYSRLALQRYGGANPPKFSEYLGEVIGAGERARDLVAQMLAFGRGEHAEIADVEIPPLVDELMKLLRPGVASSIGISVDIAPGLPTVRANRVQLQQVLLNLCINARDATGDVGHITIAARRQHFDSADCASCLGEFEGDFVVISVGDDGTGITATAQERIFEPFYTTKPEHEGSGMGLAMVHGIVHRLGGHIGLLSAPGRGSTFSIALPEFEAQAEAPTAATAAAASATAWTNAAWPARVLVVDDEPAVAECTVEMLELAGFEASFETDPAAALARLQRDPAAVDVLLTDQTMPRITGHQLAKAAMSLRPDLPVLLITGHSTAIDEATALACGIRAFLRKPADPERLLGAVNAALPARPGGLSA